MSAVREDAGAHTHLAVGQSHGHDAAAGHNVGLEAGEGEVALHVQSIAHDAVAHVLALNACGQLYRFVGRSLTACGSGGLGSTVGVHAHSQVDDGLCIGNVNLAVLVGVVADEVVRGRVGGQFAAQQVLYELVGVVHLHVAAGVHVTGDGALSRTHGDGLLHVAGIVAEEGQHGHILAGGGQHLLYGHGVAVLRIVVVSQLVVGGLGRRQDAHGSLYAHGDFGHAVLALLANGHVVGSNLAGSHVHGEGDVGLLFLEVLVLLHHGSDGASAHALDGHLAGVVLHLGHARVARYEADVVVAVLDDAVGEVYVAVGQVVVGGLECHSALILRDGASHGQRVGVVVVGVAKHEVAYGIGTGVGSGRNLVAEVHAVYRVLQFAIVGSAYGSDGACANQLLSLAVVGQHEGCGSGTQLGVGFLDGEGGLLRVHVVALTGGGHLGGAGVHVALEGKVIVGACGQDGVAVLHGNGRLLSQAVEDERLGIKFHSENLCVGRYDAVLSCHASGEVGRLGLGSHGGCVGAHVGLLVTRHVIVLSAYADGAGAHGSHLCCLLFLIISKGVLREGHRGQRSLGDAHGQRLGGHVVVVLIAHGLVVHGVLSGVQSGAHGRGVVHAVERVLHLAALNQAGVQQRLSLTGIYQALLHGRVGHGSLGLQDVEGLLGRAGEVVVRGCCRDGQRGQTGVGVVLIRYGVVRAGVQRHAVVGHCRGRLQGVARVGLVGDGANHILGQFLRVDVERVIERAAEVVHTLHLHAGLARLGVVLVGGVVVAGCLVRTVVQTLNEHLAVVGDDERGILRRAGVGDARHGRNHLAAQVARVDQEVGGQLALVLADTGHGELCLSGVHVVLVADGVVHVSDECRAYVAHHHLRLLAFAGVDDGVFLATYGVGRQSGDVLADAEGLRCLADVVVVVALRLGRDDGRGGVHAHIRVVLVGHGVVRALSERVVAVGHNQRRSHGAAGPCLVGNGVDHVVGQRAVGIVGVHLHVVGRHGERIDRVHIRRLHRQPVQHLDAARRAARGPHAAERRIGAGRHAVAHVALAGFHYYRHHVALIGGGHGLFTNLECQRPMFVGPDGQVVGARGHGHRGQCEQCKNFLFHILFYFNVSFSNLL